jgi:hypothetical protein
MDEPTSGSTGDADLIPPPPKRGFRPGCLIAILVALVVIGVGGYLLYRAGVDLIAGQVQQELGDHPMVERHLGVLTECEMDLEATDAIGKEDWFAFRVRGPKGRGVLQVRLDVKDTEHMVKEARLVTEDDETYELPLGEE